MPDNEESYFSKHHWSIVQCLLAFYCGGLATWEHFHPRLASAIQSASATPPAPTGAAMTTYLMPVWLWLGIVGLALSVAIPAITRMWRTSPWLNHDKKLRIAADSLDARIETLQQDVQKVKNQELMEKVRSECAEDARKNEAAYKADLWRANEIRQQCESERQEALQRVADVESQLGIFSPLQMDVLRFHRKLASFLEEFGPEPVCDTSDCLENPRLNAERLTEWHNQVMPFRARLRSLYNLNFRSEALELYDHLVVARISSVHFGSLADTATSIGDMKDMVTTLWIIAGQIGEGGNEES